LRLTQHPGSVLFAQSNLAQVHRLSERLLVPLVVFKKAFNLGVYVLFRQKAHVRVEVVYIRPRHLNDDRSIFLRASDPRATRQLARLQHLHILGPLSQQRQHHLDEETFEVGVSRRYLLDLVLDVAQFPLQILNLVDLAAVLLQLFPQIRDLTIRQLHWLRLKVALLLFLEPGAQIDKTLVSDSAFWLLGAVKLLGSATWRRKHLFELDLSIADFQVVDDLMGDKSVAEALLNVLRVGIAEDDESLQMRFLLSRLGSQQSPVRLFAFADQTVVDLTLRYLVWREDRVFVFVNQTVVGEVLAHEFVSAARVLHSVEVALREHPHKVVARVARIRR